jgi:hypothetical protein
MILKPFLGTVNAEGQAIVTIDHNLHGLMWKIYQVGFGLGQQALNAQVAAHVNGIPLMSTVAMQPSAFASIPTQAPYAMESFMVGPPYIYLQAGDMIVCAVINAVAGDTFTCGAYLDEQSSSQAQSMGS